MLRLFFSVEVLMFCGVYSYGKNSIVVLVKQQRENLVLQKQLEEKKQAIAQLEKVINNWESHTFYKEKIAREQLQMVGPQDHVYYITHAMS